MLIRGSLKKSLKFSHELKERLYLEVTKKLPLEKGGL